MLCAWQELTRNPTVNSCRTAGVFVFLCSIKFMTTLFSDQKFTVLIHPHWFNKMIKYHIPNKKIIIFIQSNVSMDVLSIRINASSFFIPSQFLASVYFVTEGLMDLKVLKEMLFFKTYNLTLNCIYWMVVVKHILCLVSQDD